MASHPSSSSTSLVGASLEVDPIKPPDLTHILQQNRKVYAGRGSFAIVYKCPCIPDGVVAVKVMTLPQGLDRADEESYRRKSERELGIWRRLDHPNIVPLLGTAHIEGFAQDLPCMVATWMPNGTLSEYIKKHDVTLSPSDRVQLIKGIVAGLVYLHSKSLVHGDFHPHNVMVDENHNARLMDFNFSQTQHPETDLIYLWTRTIRPGARMWVAPEILFPHLYPSFTLEAAPKSDIYSLGSIILFVLSGVLPWPTVKEAEDNLQRFRNPPRPESSTVSDSVWELVVRCWSPRFPNRRPSAQNVLQFFEDKPERVWEARRYISPLATAFFRRFHEPQRHTNVVFFGKAGAGKSSIINLINGDPVVKVSSGACVGTTEPRSHGINTPGMPQFQAWDTPGFGPANSQDNALAQKSARKLVGQLSKKGGIDLLVFVKMRGSLAPSEHSCYKFFCEELCEGKVPVALVVTHLESYEPMETWWDSHGEGMLQKLGTNVIGRACITAGGTTEPDTWFEQQLEASRLSVEKMLKACVSLRPSA